MKELKPCPFCGGEECETYTVEETAFVQNYDLTMREDRKFFLWGAGCYECSAKVYGFDTEEEAITAWNTRAEAKHEPMEAPFAIGDIVEEIGDPYDRKYEVVRETNAYMTLESIASRWWHMNRRKDVLARKWRKVER